MKTPTGIKRIHTEVYSEARLAATPFGCGRCLPCRINQARVWKHRILLEQKVWSDSSFVTLTYDDEKLESKNLIPEHLSLYIKRLRKNIVPRKIRYFAVGEYGDKNWRPHYHLALFGLGQLDEEVIDKSWQKGFTQVGDLNNNSAAYMVGYCTAKLTKRKLLGGRSKEFMHSSKGDGGLGIGAIRIIAKKLLENKFEDRKIIKELKYGNKSMPLGRYLTKKLAEEINVDESEFLSDFWVYQEEIFEKHMKNKGLYYDNLTEDKKSDRLSQEKKHKIFSAKRGL